MAHMVQKDAEHVQLKNLPKDPTENGLLDQPGALLASSVLDSSSGVIESVSNVEYENTQHVDTRERMESDIESERVLSKQDLKEEELDYLEKVLHLNNEIELNRCGGLKLNTWKECLDHGLLVTNDDRALVKERLDELDDLDEIVLEVVQERLEDERKSRGSGLKALSLLCAGLEKKRRFIRYGDQKISPLCLAVLKKELDLVEVILEVEYEDIENAMMVADGKMLKFLWSKMKDKSRLGYLCTVAAGIDHVERVQVMVDLEKHVERNICPIAGRSYGELAMQNAMEKQCHKVLTWMVQDGIVTRAEIKRCIDFGFRRDLRNSIVAIMVAVDQPWMVEYIHRLKSTVEKSQYVYVLFDYYHTRHI